MIPLLRTTQQVALVWSDDPSVTLTQPLLDDDGDPVSGWVERTAAGVGPDALVATVRPMSHLETVDCTGRSAGLKASTTGTLTLEGPGLDGDTSARLERLPLAVRLALGNAIIRLSALPPDPTEAS